MWVSDTGNNRIEALTSAGAYAGALAMVEPVTAPQAIATLKTGTEQTLYVGVTTSTEPYVLVYRGSSPAAMTFISAFGGAGSGNGKFTGAIGGLVVDESAAKLYATDTGGHRVEVFSTAGVYQSQFGTSGTGEEHFSAPQGLAVQSGNVFVADKTNGNVQKVSGSSFLHLFPAAAGAYAIATYPQATDGSMYVLNQTTGKIAKWTAQAAFDLPTGSTDAGYECGDDTRVRGVGLWRQFALQHEQQRSREMGTDGHSGRSHGGAAAGFSGRAGLRAAATFSAAPSTTSTATGARSTSSLAVAPAA